MNGLKSYICNNSHNIRMYIPKYAMSLITYNWGCKLNDLDTIFRRKLNFCNKKLPNFDNGNGKLSKSEKTNKSTYRILIFQ